MKMYRVGYGGHKIEEREVIRETASFVFFASEWDSTREVREAKRETWFQTWDEAHAFALKRANDRVNATQQQLVRDLAQVEKIKAMTAEVRQ